MTTAARAACPWAAVGRGGAGPGASKTDDPRAITTREFKQRAIEKLVSYLTNHGYDRAIPVKMVQNLEPPTTKDFVQMISFLLKATIPNFEFGSKFEEELPNVLKSIGYPFTLNKAALQNVGAPTSWPKILAMLDWLVSLLAYFEATSDAADASNNELFDDEDGNKMFLDYLQRGYALFLQGTDDLSELEEQIAFTFETKNASLHSDIASLSQANAELSQQHTALTEGETPLVHAKRKNGDLLADAAKFEKHIANLRSTGRRCRSGCCRSSRRRVRCRRSWRRCSRRSPRTRRPSPRRT